MKKLFCITLFLIILMFLSSAAAGLEHKPFPTQQEKATTAAEPSKENPGFFAWLLVLLALSIGVGLVLYAVLMHEKKPKNPQSGTRF